MQINKHIGSNFHDFLKEKNIFEEINEIVTEKIESEEEYNKALKRADKLMKLNPPENSKESEELVKLVDTIETYEKKFWNIEESRE